MSARHVTRLVAVALLSGPAVLTSAPFVRAETTVASAPVGAVAAAAPVGQTGLALPLTRPDAFVGVVEAHAGASLSFAAAHGDIGARLDPDRPYYVEVLTGRLEGERLDVDVPETIAAAGPMVVLALSPGTNSTLAAVPDAALVGARCALRPHVRLADLPAMFLPPLAGHDVPGHGDGVWLFEKGSFRFYRLRADNVTWTRPGSATDVRGKVVPPDTSLLVDVRTAPKEFVNGGDVRLNDFRKSLSTGLQSFATGFPADLTPAQARAFVDPATPAEKRWTGSQAPSHADEIRLVHTNTSAIRLFLAADGTSWRALGDPTSLSDAPVLRALGMVLVERKNADPAYRIPAPFVF